MTQSWDLLIKGAKVFDGSGALPSIQDVAVRNGKIAARGDSLPADAAAPDTFRRGIHATEKFRGRLAK